MCHLSRYKLVCPTLSLLKQEFPCPRWSGHWPDPSALKSGRKERRLDRGEGGIRTLGTPEGYNGFRDRPIQPLWHLSEAANILRRPRSMATKAQRFDKSRRDARPQRAPKGWWGLAQVLYPRRRSTHPLERRREPVCPSEYLLQP